MDAKMDRLRRRREFLTAARGRKWAAPGLVLQAHERGDTDPLRVGYTVTKKVGTAVTRNRAKRRLRAAAAEILPSLGKPGYDYVLIGRTGTLTRAWPDLLEDLRAALARVHSARRSVSPQGGKADKQRPAKNVEK